MQFFIKQILTFLKCGKYYYSFELWTTLFVTTDDTTCRVDGQHYMSWRRTTLLVLSTDNTTCRDDRRHYLSCQRTTLLVLSTDNTTCRDDGRHYLSCRRTTLLVVTTDREFNSSVLVPASYDNWSQFHILNMKVFATNLNFLISISLQPNDISNLDYLI